MPEPQTFDLSDILSVTTGRFLSSRGIAGVYAILGYLTGTDLYTHQLPRAMQVCAPEVLLHYPALHPGPDLTILDAALDTATSPADKERVVVSWLAQQRLVYGESFPMTPLPPGRADFSMPVADLVAMVGAERVIVVECPAAPDQPREATP